MSSSYKDLEGDRPESTARPPPPKAFRAWGRLRCLPSGTWDGGFCGFGYMDSILWILFCGFCSIDSVLWTQFYGLGSVDSVL